MGAGSFFQELGSLRDLAGNMRFAFQFGPIILASGVLVGFRPAPHTCRGNVVLTCVSIGGEKRCLEERATWVCWWGFAGALALRWRPVFVWRPSCSLANVRVEVVGQLPGVCVPLHRVATGSVLQCGGPAGVEGPIGGTSAALVPCCGVVDVRGCLRRGVCQIVSLGFSALCLAAGSVYSRL